MELSGRYRIAADRETVWRSLNDPEILARAVPGCEAFDERVGEDGARAFAATVKMKVGPVSATFKGEVALENVSAPESYRLRGEGKGGVAGFGKGFADVRLTELDGGAATQLDYAGEAQVGGKLAQIGSRLIGGTVKKLAGQFFEKFAAELGAEAEEMPLSDDGAASA